MRSDVWSDIHTYRLGHWLTGRIGGCGLAELVRQLCQTRGVPLDLIDETQRAATVAGYAITDRNAEDSGVIISDFPMVSGRAAGTAMRA